MNRDRYKSVQYFERYIDKQKERIEKFLNILSTIPENDKKKRGECTRYLANFYKDLLSAEYSAGRSAQAMKGICEMYISALSECSITEYAELVDVLSLAILFNMKSTEIKKINYDTSFHDKLVLSLKKQIDGETQLLDTKLIYPNYYGIFYQYLSGGVNREEFLDAINTKWYAASCEFAWHDSHKGKGDTYVGYWCWLAGAILKIKNVKEAQSFFVPDRLLL